jgi:hypothetical protein
MWYKGDHEAAFRLADEAFETSRKAGSPRSEAQALGLLGELAFERGDVERGIDLLEASASVAGRIGFRWWHARMLLRAAKRAREVGRATDACRWALESLELADAASDRRRTIQALDLLSAVAADAEQYDRAGFLRGAVEAEIERDPIPAWAMTPLPAAATTDETFERSRVEGIRSELGHAVAHALAS